MSLLRLLIEEIRHRKLNFALGVLAVTGAVALFVALLTTGRAAQDETRRLMRDMGFNLLIIPRGTEMQDFWASDFAEKDMPEEYVHQLAATPWLSMDHYVAILEKKVRWQGHSILLTGMLAELGNIGKRKKSPMGYQIPRGTCYVGYELARSLKIDRGATLDVLGRELKVERCLLESGSKDDIRIYAHLHDVQDALGKRGRINTIQALGCLCYGYSLSTLREQLARALPGTKVTEFRSIALARAEMRQTVARYVAFILPIVLAICAVSVGLLSLVNVRQRRQEIGLFRALGFGSASVATLFMGRAAVIGVVGAVLGFAAGTALALQFGPAIFKITHAHIEPLYDLLAWSAVIAPFVAALASFVPAMVAVTQDPAIILAQE